ncbi:3-isopropylmalate dehydratase, small subunit [marine gamma proteobacterium HTCC2148]|jgi:3-isopropylmalate/(R)-2-methylmalate dehydratase small subunit|nr:3-isopropylmalate dehydratase, small subunit [marine gamma proteobacterium HTCC2148]
MDKFIQHLGVAAPLIRSNVDTDAIIPSREMKRVSKQGLGEGLFAGWRYLQAGGRDAAPEFVLNQDAYRDASIILSGPNFGCGSSREHAVWALAEYGIRVVVAPSFGTIFANNCIRNGLLPLVLGANIIAEIAAWVAQDPCQNKVLVDLPEQQLQASGEAFNFEIEPWAKRMLVEGLDAISLTQTRWQTIDRFHRHRQSLRPWLYQH